MCIGEAKIVAPITKREPVYITDSTKSPTTLRFLSNSEVALFWYYFTQGKQISHSRMWVCRGSLSTFFWSRKNLIAVCKNKLDQKIKNKVSSLRVESLAAFCAKYLKARKQEIYFILFWIEKLSSKFKVLHWNLFNLLNKRSTINNRVNQKSFYCGKSHAIAKIWFNSL